MKKLYFTTFNKSIGLLLLINVVIFFALVYLYFCITNIEATFFSKIKNNDNNFVNEIALDFMTLKNTLNVLLIFVIISSFFTVFLLKKWLLVPIKLITSALETGNKKSIKLLKIIPGEFQYIGNLFQNNANRKFELVSAKNKAEENERLKSTFLENLSHEIRTPMNAIIGFTDLLLTTTLSEAENNEYLSIIHKSGSNLVSIIEDLIEMSKIEANQIAPNYSIVDLENCLKELYNTIKVDIPKSKNIDFHIIESKTKLNYNIKVDEVKLKQILINLIYNAIKFTQEGYVTFGYEIIEIEELPFIEFRVKDTGIGITKENQKNIFDRFKRVESDLTIETGGLGLGLSITKAYIEMMGGTISTCQNEKKGTIFIFNIPLKYDKKDKIETQKSTNVEIEITSKIKTILVVEDDNINFILIKKMLQVLEYEIIRAENGKIAVDMVTENERINLVLMDIKMPVMNGYEAFAHISKIRPKLPVIAQTAHASEEDKEKVKQAGFTEYITKPINKNLLLEMVEKYAVKNTI